MHIVQMRGSNRSNFQFPTSSKDKNPGTFLLSERGPQTDIQAGAHIEGAHLFLFLVAVLHGGRLVREGEGGRGGDDLI